MDSPGSYLTSDVKRVVSMRRQRKFPGTPVGAEINKKKKQVGGLASFLRTESWGGWGPGLYGLRTAGAARHQVWQ